MDAYEYASCSYIMDAYEYASRSYIMDAYEYASCLYIMDAYEYASCSCIMDAYEYASCTVGNQTNGSMYTLYHLAHTMVLPYLVHRTHILSTVLTAHEKQFELGVSLNHDIITSF
jgi:hypothetical protein